MTASRPVFRFAPSPNGELHLGHAFSALLNLKLARKMNGKMLLRIEDIDRVRCTPENEARMLKDLESIGFEWDAPPRRQSEHFDDYRDAVDQLFKKGALFPSILSRSEIRNLANTSGETNTDPDGALLYPGKEHLLSVEEQTSILTSGIPYALRLNTEVIDRGEKIFWQEFSDGRTYEDPKKWGKPVIARKDTPTSYHLSCVIDDALQGITHVVRGMDLYQATSIHSLLQVRLDLSQPIYHHHALVLDETGQKLSKSKKDTSLRQLKDAGQTAEEILAPLMPLLEHDQFYETCAQEQTNHHASDKN